jgi:rRNA maturation protein Nop10
MSHEDRKPAPYRTRAVWTMVCSKCGKKIKANDPVWYDPPNKAWMCEACH